MKLNKIFTYFNKKQIWRILPTTSNKVLIEERSTDKQVYFTCLDLTSGNKIFKDFQLDEKFWVGVETVMDDIIYYHKYEKPDLPTHRGIYAVDIYTQKELWHNDNYLFSFAASNKIFCMQQNFESTEYFAVDPISGEIIERLGSDVRKIKDAKFSAEHETYHNSYLFPEAYSDLSIVHETIKKYLNQILKDETLSGRVENIFVDDTLFMSYNITCANNSFSNIFKAINVHSSEIILNEILAENLTMPLTDSFFIKDNFIFLLKGKYSFEVFSIIN